jgi:hypothetical protein
MPTSFDPPGGGQRAAIREILNQLPPDHPALAAYEAGADAVALMRLVAREDLVEKLEAIWLEWYAWRLRLQTRRARMGEDGSPA